MDIQEFFIDMEWGKLAARSYGTGSGVPVIGFHGLLDNASTFDPLFFLLKANNPLISIDLPGHGHSDHYPKGFAYDFTRFALDAGRALQALGYPKYVLLGHSLGAGLSSILGGVLQPQVVGLVLIDAVGLISCRPEDGPVLMRKYFESSKPAIKKESSVYADVKSAVEARLKAGGLAYESARILTERNLQKMPNGYVWKSDPALRLPTPTRMSEEQILAFLGNIKCPTLIIRSDAKLFDETYWAKRTAAIPGARLVRAEGGHHLHLDNPERIAPAIRDFLTTL